MAKQPPADLKAVLSKFLCIAENHIELEKCVSYRSYFNRTWAALSEGEPAEGDNMPSIDKKDISLIAQTITNLLLNKSCQRTGLRDVLSKYPPFDGYSEESLNRSIDLTLRLWLVLNIRAERFSPGVKAIQWNDTLSLPDFIANQFPQPKSLQKHSDFVLPSNFTAMNLRRYSGIKVAWTYSLNEHLVLDQNHRKLKIFPLKYYLQMTMKSDLEIIPDDVIAEYCKTINFLFPNWDVASQDFLQRKKQTFGTEEPVDYPGLLYLSDFLYFRDRLSTLYAEFLSPPPSMTQLLNDRRNVLQWYTFWFAVLIVFLTMVFGLFSSVTSVLSTRYAYQSLLAALDAQASAKACPPITCGNTVALPTPR